MPRRPRLAFAVTHPATASILLRGQLAYLRANGFDVAVVSGLGPELALLREREGVETFGVDLSRELRPWEAPSALAAMRSALHRFGPDILNASTPKAALLSLLAARVLPIPRRLYQVRGLRLEGATGWRRSVLRALERSTVALATDIVCVSRSLHRACMAERVIAPGREVSLIPSNGIDLDHFRSRAATATLGLATRHALGIDANALVFGFVGRLALDKGIEDILGVMERISASRPEASLLIVGGDLAGDALSSELTTRLRKLPRVHSVARVDDTAPYYAAMDVLLFPSHREGLPNVPLEAAAMEVPTLGYRVTGVTDAVDDGVTGRLVALGDVPSLAAGALEYGSPSVRRDHGMAARRLVMERFSQSATWARWLELYRSLAPK